MPKNYENIFKLHTQYCRLFFPGTVYIVCCECFNLRAVVGCYNVGTRRRGEFIPIFESPGKSGVNVLQAKFKAYRNTKWTVWKCQVRLLNITDRLLTLETQMTVKPKFHYADFPETSPLDVSRGSFGVSDHRDMSRWFEKIP